MNQTEQRHTSGQTNRCNYRIKSSRGNKKKKVLNNYYELNTVGSFEKNRDIQKI